VRLEIDAQSGGRIASLRFAGIDLLTGRDVDPTNWGSTLWTSPQTDWGWPPPPEFDDVSFALSEDDGAIVLTGPPCESLGVSLSKRISLHPETAAIAIEYGIRNVGTRPRAFAHWEISRVPPRGLTFFPTGASAAGTLAVTRAGAGTWFDHDPGALTDVGAKSFADSDGGFIAHLAQRILFVKSFADVGPKDQAPGEGEVEIYANNRYVEVEVQGPYMAIEPDEVALWRVNWNLCALPSNLSASVGSEALFAFAAGIARAGAPVTA
jgi:hypothetical protein